MPASASPLASASWSKPTVGPVGQIQTTKHVRQAPQLPQPHLHLKSFWWNRVFRQSFGSFSIHVGSVIVYLWHPLDMTWNSWQPWPHDFESLDRLDLRSWFAAARSCIPDKSMACGSTFGILLLGLILVGVCLHWNFRLQIQCPICQKTRYEERNKSRFHSSKNTVTWRHTERLLHGNPGNVGGSRRQGFELTGTTGRGPAPHRRNVGLLWMWRRMQAASKWTKYTWYSNVRCCHCSWWNPCCL